jgi:hypothetical protein
MICMSNSLLIDIHYKDLGIQEMWDTRRVDRLCSLLKVTRDELASMIMFEHSEMDKCIKLGEFPGPVCLLLTLVENFTVGSVVPDPASQELLFNYGIKKNTKTL